MRNVLLFTAIAWISALPLSALEARPDPSIRPTLESAYEAWRVAMAADDIRRWEETTAFSRQIEIRNRIVSQRAPFPAAMFEDPVEAPSLGGLIALGVLSTGETATSTYFGKANFGIDPALAVTDNLLVLHFLKEDGIWKYDNMRVVKLGTDGEVLLQIRNGDFSFLQGQEFQPAAQLPPIPQPVNAPDILAEAWIDSTGHEVTVRVNGHLTGAFTNVKTSELVIGGLKRGQNTISIESKAEAGLTDSPAKVEVAIYAAEDPGSKADRVYHFNPGATVPARVEETFVVE